MLKAECYVALKKYNKALKCCNDVLSKNSNSIEALLSKSNIHIQKGEYEKSYETSENILEINPNNGNAWFHKDRALYVMEDGRNKEVMECFDKCLEINPEHAEALSHKGALYDVAEEYEKGREYLKKSLSINPKSDQALNLLARNYYDTEEYSKAFECCAKILDIDETNYHALHLATGILANMDEYELLFGLVELALKYYPNDEYFINLKNTMLEN